MPAKKPILFIVFNRPETTKRVFEAIRAHRPEQLFVAADGPRTTKEGERERCMEVRDIVLKGVDWPCEVRTLLRDENLGCKKAVSSAIDWFFSQVEEGIILEDDCVPDQSFFTFCATLLEKYRNNPRVMHIGGTNYYTPKSDMESYYYFTNFPRVWGWATWRRAWKLYDRDMTTYQPFEFSYHKHPFHSIFVWVRWEQALHRTHLGRIDTWDYQWVYSVWKNDTLSIAPARNLIENIGFGKDATHTTGPNNIMGIPASHMPDKDFTKPDSAFAINIEADIDFEKKISHMSLLSKIRIVVNFLVCKIKALPTLLIR